MGGAALIVERLLRRELLRRKLGEAGKGELGVLEIGLILLDLPLGGLQGRLEAPRIDLSQEITLPDGLSFGEQHILQDAFDLRMAAIDAACP